MSKPNLTEADIDRISLATALRGAGVDLIGIAALMAYRRAASPVDVIQASDAVHRALGALGHYGERAAARAVTDQKETA